MKFITRHQLGWFPSTIEMWTDIEDKGSPQLFNQVSDNLIRWDSIRVLIRREVRDPLDIE